MDAGILRPRGGSKKAAREAYEQKAYLMKQGGGVCEDCGATERSIKYFDKRYGKYRFRSSIELHHINDCFHDNRLINLMLLCRDCHRNLHRGDT